jgi:tripartite-type tricarboxylate transporter receptor subunit TctC
MSGQVDAMCETASTLLPFVNSGKLQVAGLTSAAGGLLPQFSGFGRLPAPTSGAVSLWTGLFAPKGTPDGVINRLSQALFRLNEDTSYKQQQASQGRSVIVDTRQTVAGHSQFLAEDVSRWATVRMD